MGREIFNKIVDSAEVKAPAKSAISKEARDRILYNKESGKYFVDWNEGRPMWSASVKSAAHMTQKRADSIMKRIPTGNFEVQPVNDSTEVAQEDIEKLETLNWPSDKEEIRKIAAKYYGSRDSIRNADRKELIAFSRFTNKEGKEVPAFSFKQRAWEKIQDSARVQDDVALQLGGPMVETMAIYKKGGADSKEEIYKIRFAVTASKIPSVVAEPVYNAEFKTLKEAIEMADYVGRAINEGFQKAWKKIKGHKKVTDSFFREIAAGDTLRVIRGENPGCIAEVVEKREDGSFYLKDLKTGELFDEPKDLYAVFVEVTDSFEEEKLYTKEFARDIQDSAISKPIAVTDEKEYTKEQLIANPPKWVANHELWEECVDLATKKGSRPINVVVPLVIYKRKGGEKAKSQAERKAQAEVDGRRMEAEISRENVEDSTKSFVELPKELGGIAPDLSEIVIPNIIRVEGEEEAKNAVRCIFSKLDPKVKREVYKLVKQEGDVPTGVRIRTVEDILKYHDSYDAAGFIEDAFWEMRDEPAAQDLAVDLIKKYKMDTDTKYASSRTAVKDDSIPIDLSTRIKEALKSKENVKETIHSVIASFANGSGGEAKVVEDRVEFPKGSARFEDYEILIEQGPFTEFYDVEKDIEAYGKRILELTK